MEGKVKWFNEKLGYGFIDSIEKKDIFVYHSEIQKEGYKKLKKGQIISFQLEDTIKGLLATKVIILKDNTDSEEDWKKVKKNSIRKRKKNKKISSPKIW